MKQNKLPWALAVAATLIVMAGPALASYVRHMNLRQLCDSAESIFRGTVLDSTNDFIEAGGGQIPIIIYRLRVEEAFQGVGGQEELEIRMLDPKPVTRNSGSARYAPLLKGLPRLEVGETYLLFMTRPSSLALSTTVGLGQGCFLVRAGKETTTAVNEIGNQGLFKDMAAPASPNDYPSLADEIRRLLGGR